MSRNADIIVTDNHINEDIINVEITSRTTSEEETTSSIDASYGVYGSVGHYRFFKAGLNEFSIA